MQFDVSRRNREGERERGKNFFGFLFRIKPLSSQNNTVTSVQSVLKQWAKGRNLVAQKSQKGFQLIDNDN